MTLIWIELETIGIGYSSSLPGDNLYDPTIWKYTVFFLEYPNGKKAWTERVIYDYTFGYESVNYLEVREITIIRIES